MALYAIGDLHLSILSEKTSGNVIAGLFPDGSYWQGAVRKYVVRKHYELYKPMEVFDPVWKNHADKLWRHWQRMVRPEDTVVITGDHSWGDTLETCAVDFAFIEALPGRKILLRGNHDLFWKADRTRQLNSMFAGRFSFLQNNFYSYGDYALVGTKGCCYEGKDSREHFEKLRDREMERLEISFEKASQAGYRKFLMFLHYPPTSAGEQESCFTRIAKAYGVEQVIYSHLHGQKRYYESLRGEVDGRIYRLVSSDYLRFKPVRLL